MARGGTMDWIKKINWDKLKNPHPMFKQFIPTSEDPTDPFFLKVSKLQRLLMKRPLWLSDEYRTPQGIEAIIASFFSGSNFTVFYEVGEFQALIGFVNIQPEFKCELSLELIDAKIWGADLVRAGRELVELFVKEFRLKRISAGTADSRIARMAEMIGFKAEGYRPNDFMWDGKYYDKYLLGKYGE
jgi:RimJ/RimL family protein N-acetyltransferase